MADLSNVRIDGARLWDSLMEMAKIGATPKGGCKRLTLTDLDKQGRELFTHWCERRRLHGQGRRDGQHVRAPPGTDDSAAARHDGQPPRHPADRRQVRRRARRARRARGHALAERPQHPDQASDRGRQLDQRGRLALRARHDVVGRVRRRLYQGIRLFARSTPRASRSATSSKRIGFKGDGARRRPSGARLLRAAYRAGPDPGGRVRSTSASSPMDRASAGTKFA